ncbi:hypothetical protein EDB80DRAFT_814194 [Ilyonectria destructans]|nr:hypothetical protein EDB80DRAFT_814194 [Ilyonectria destructans]
MEAPSMWDGGWMCDAASVCRDRCWKACLEVQAGARRWDNQGCHNTRTEPEQEKQRRRDRKKKHLGPQKETGMQRCAGCVRACSCTTAQATAVIRSGMVGASSLPVVGGRCSTILDPGPVHVGSHARPCDRCHAGALWSSFSFLFPFPTTSRVGISARGRRLQRGVGHRRIGARRFTVVAFASSLSSHSHVANDRFIDVDELMRHGHACWPVSAPPRAAALACSCRSALVPSTLCLRVCTVCGHWRRGV